MKGGTRNDRVDEIIEELMLTAFWREPVINNRTTHRTYRSGNHLRDDSGTLSVEIITFTTHDSAAERMPG